MSLSRAPTEDPFESINENREDVEVLAERDDYLGALARVFLALADGEVPKREDCAEADLEAVYEFVQDGGSR